jgi:hypothetical protein
VNPSLAWLGLRADADERDVKRAYAARLKTVRPDEDPAGFQLLREHYEQALAWCAHRARMAEAEAVAATSDDVETDGGSEEAWHAEEHDADDEDARIVRPPRAVPPVAASEDIVHTIRRTVPPAPHTEPPVRPARMPPPVPGGSPKIPPITAPDPQSFVAAYIPQAIKLSPPQLESWLHSREDLWSLNFKSRAGQQLLQSLFREPQAIGALNLDATLKFFGLDHAQSGIDPLQLHRLRGHMQERHELLLKHKAEVQPWGIDPATFDLDTFLAWCSEHAEEGERNAMAAKLYVQPALNVAALRERVAPALLQRLTSGRYPLPQDIATLLLQYFNVASVAQREKIDISDLPARLHMRWLMLPKNIGKLAKQTRAPSETHDPSAAKRRLRSVTKPFQWWRVLLICLVPRLPMHLGMFLWRFCGGVPQRLDGISDTRTARWWIGAATRQRMTAQRWLITAWRGLVLTVLAGALSLYLYLFDPPYTPGDAWLPVSLAGIGSLFCLCYLGFISITLWQCRPQQPEPRLHAAWRQGFIPLLCVIGAAIFFVNSAQIHDGDIAPAVMHSQFVLLPAVWFAYMRFRTRSAEGAAWSLPRNAGVGYFLLIALAGLFMVPLLSAVVTLGFWLADLIKQNKKRKEALREKAA